MLFMEAWNMNFPQLKTNFSRSVLIYSENAIKLKWHENRCFVTIAFQFVSEYANWTVQANQESLVFNGTHPSGVF
jgi:hypothetical protein